LSNPTAGPKAELEAVGAIADIDLGVLAQRIGLGGTWGGTIDVEELQVAGPLNALRLDARFAARRLVLNGQTVDYVAGRVSAGADLSVEVPQKDPIVARVGTSEVRLWGSLGADQKLDLTLETPEGKSINIEDLYRFDPAVVALTGTLGLKTRVTGTLSEPLVLGEEITIKRLAVNGATFGLGDGRFVASKDSVRVNFVLNGEEVAANPDRREVYDVDGTVWPMADLSVTARLEAVPIQKLLQLARIPPPPVDVRGKVTAAIRVKGREPRPDVELVKLVVEDAGVGPQAIQVLTAEGIALEEDVVSVRKLHAALPEGATLDVSGKVALAEEGPIALQIAGERLDLALAQRWLPLEGSLGGTGRLEATVGGSRAAPTLEGSLRVEGARFNQFSLDLISAALSYRDNVARIDDFRVERAYADVPRAEGSAAATPPAEGAPESPRFVATGAAAIPFNWTKRSVPSDAPLTGYLSIDQQDLSSLLKVIAPQTAAEGGAPLPRQVETVNGTLTLRVDLAGTVTQPDLRGKVLVTASDVVVRNVAMGKDPTEALRLRGLDVALDFERDQIRVNRVCVASARPLSGRRARAA
ncbi:MAG: hypothetical protein QHJ73_16865, partial [Armatimonadota bacterium]|nr:hypothetical protein [Armatimonadota bacterium]